VEKELNFHFSRAGGLGLLQHVPLREVGETFVEKIIFYLNYPFINQNEFKVSVLSILLLFLVLLISVLFSRYIRKFLENRVLVKMHADPGMQYTLLRVVHYIILVLGLMYGLKLGFSLDLTSIAVILGFLSVGIGFGLQYIASDVVSGLVLLFERPVRIGDRIKINDVEGRVESIRVRTTIVITNDNISVIVPNSELVRNQVINWSYVNSRHVRIRVPVGVAYDSDIQRVVDTLLQAASSVKDILDSPPARVHMVGFGDSSINMELLAWIDRPHDHPRIRSNINFQIQKLFQANGIVIPFPQRDIRVSGEILNR
jgi:small-conductance mechanosensitive channel